MSIIFIPDGSLDICTDAAQLPQVVGDGSIVSGAMQRCKNLRLDESRVLKCRDGISAVNSSPVVESVGYSIFEKSGTRYLNAGDSIYYDETEIDNSYTRAGSSMITYNVFNSAEQNVFFINGDQRKRFVESTVYEWGVDAPGTACVAHGGTSGSLSGVYSGKYTYVRKEGSTVVFESNPSDASESITLDDSVISLTASAPSDTQITHIRFYRTTAGGSVYYYTGEIDLNGLDLSGSYTHSFEADYVTGTSFGYSNALYTYVYTWEVDPWNERDDDDTVYDTQITDGQAAKYTYNSAHSDSALGSLVNENHNRPPTGNFAIGPNYNGTCFILDDNKVYFSLAKQPEYWPDSYYVELGPLSETAISAVFHNGQLYVLTKNDIFFIQGTGSDTFFPLKMEAITGCQGRFCALSVFGKGIYHVGYDGIYLYSSDDRNITNYAFRPIFRGETVNDVPGVYDIGSSWLIQWRDKLYFGYKDSGDTAPSNVLVFYLTSNRVSYFSYPVGFFCVFHDKYNDRIIAYGTDGYIYELEDADATDDDGDAIEWEMETKDFTLQTRKHFPRWVKYDTVVSAADDVTADLKLDGVSVQSHVLTEDRNTRRRLVNTSNGDKCSIKISGTGQVEIYMIESE